LKHLRIEALRDLGIYDLLPPFAKGD
jgi:hypothetical protein